MLTKLKYRNTNTFLIHGKSGNVLIDTDYAGTLPMFYKAIKEHDISVKDINYILATHFHPDHVGLVSELMEQGVRLILMESQVGAVHFPDGIFARETGLRFKPIDESAAVLLSFEESRAFLGKLGIDGEIIRTPSHSEDSVSVVLDEGICIVGDLEPLDYLSAYEDNRGLKCDWDKVMSYKPKVIYYAHANEKRL